jgi:hypothetical protein
MDYSDWDEIKVLMAMQQEMLNQHKPGLKQDDQPGDGAPRGA